MSDSDPPRDDDRGGSEPDPAFEARLSAGGVEFDDRDAAFLAAVGETGSMNAAAERLGRSYSRALDRLEDLESAYGSLVERRRGGAGGGGSELTDRAYELLSRFERLRTGFAGVAETTETVLEGSVLGLEGELGTIETPAGRIRGIVPPGVGDDGSARVEISIRADAVTLHAPESAPPAAGTSARNRFEGTVMQLQSGEAVVRVLVDVGGGDPLVALLTADSVEQMDLSPGDNVVATVKATATRATRVESGGD